MAEGLMGFDIEVVYVSSTQTEALQEVLEDVCVGFEEDSRAISLECDDWWEEIYTGPEEYFGAPYMVGCYYHE